VLELISSRIGRRLGAIVGLAMAALAVGGVSLLLDQQRRLQDQSVSEVMRTMAVGVAASFHSYDSRLGRHPISDLAADLGALIDLEVFDHEGRIHWASNAGRRGREVEPRVLTAIRGGTLEPDPQMSDQLEELVWPLPKRSSCLPCHATGPDPIGGIRLAAHRDKLVPERAAAQQLAVGLAVLVVVALTALILVLMNRMVIEPVGRLARVMSQVEEGDFFARAEVRSNDEIGLLASTFNTLVSKITDLRVERIDTERELSGMRTALELQEKLAEKTAELEQANLRLSERLEQLTFLYALGRRLSSELDPQLLVDRLGHLVRDQLAVPEFTLVLIEPGGRGNVMTAVGFRDGADLRGPGVRLEGSISADAIASRKPIYVADLAADPRRISYRGEGMSRGTLLCVPILYQEQVMGTVNYSAPQPDAFTLDKQELLIATAHQAALALANAQLFHQTLELSRTDGLTGVANRRELEARLGQEWAERERYANTLSVVMIDIDHFKHYNDELGHQQGDEVLRRVAQILESQLRKTDLLGRYGGEEFLAVLPHADKEQALTVAEKLRRSVAQADFERGFMQPLGRVTVSCGVASAPADASSLEALVQSADQALFAAKAAGRNRVQGAPKLD
jgi:diguanylate cyclase (GGDEF)-like protein